MVYDEGMAKTLSNQSLWKQHPELGVRVVYEKRDFIVLPNSEDLDDKRQETLNLWVLYWGTHVMTTVAGNGGENEANDAADKLVQDILAGRISSTGHS